MNKKKVGSLRNTLAFDFRKTITGKFSIIMLVAIIVLSLFAGLFYASISNINSGPTESISSSGYFENNSIHIVTLATSQYGNVVSGLPISVGYNGSYHNGTSDLNGYFNTTFPVILNETRLSEYGENQFIFNYSSPSVNSGFPRYTTIFYYNNTNANIKEMILSNSMQISNVPDKANSTSRSISMFYVGPNGSKAPSLTIYAKPLVRHNSTISVKFPLLGQNISTKGLIDLGTYSNFTYIVVPANTGLNNGSGYFLVYLLNQNGTLFTATVLQLYSVTSVSGVTSGFIGVISNLFAFLIPLLAIFSAFLYYAKDKTNGTMESILSRPVTRGRLITSRFLSNVVVSLIALAAGIAVIDILSSKYTGILLPDYLLLDVIWEYFVIAVAFIGLVYLISQLTKSTGLVLGISIVFYVLLVIFWTFIFSLMLPIALGLVPGTVPYAHAYLVINSLSPTGYANLITTYLEGNVVGISFSSLGVSIDEILLIGVFWLVFPFAVAFYLARNRDWVASN
ncbi:MAG: ABC transporter permease [Candidatus Thermoplasmatota archaeon]|jgi:ABC-2 type transport system permease protein|nr:ABC transporter permease [Candidatus Thermoplasmatota archaeon]